MTAPIELRESTPGDIAAIETIYPAAFPDEELRPLVRTLLSEVTEVLSLVACVDGEIVGHVVFTGCGVSGRGVRVALLGPLAVEPSRQKRGVGSALVREGHRRLAERGIVSVYTLGDPAYYGRFGFRAEQRVVPPYELPEDWAGAWQSLGLTASEEPLEGTLSVPAVWAQPALWTS